MPTTTEGRAGWTPRRATVGGGAEQIFITDSVVDEAIVLEALRRRPTWLPAIRARIDDALSTTRAWIASEKNFEWVEPKGGVVGFPRVPPEVDVDLDRFYEVLLEEYGTVVGPGHWFEQSRRHFRWDTARSTSPLA